MTIEVGPFVAASATVLPDIEFTFPCVFTFGGGVGVAGAEEDGGCSPDDGDDSADCDWFDEPQATSASAVAEALTSSAGSRVSRRYEITVIPPLFPSLSEPAQGGSPHSRWG